MSNGHIWMSRTVMVNAVGWKHKPVWGKLFRYEWRLDIKYWSESQEYSTFKETQVVFKTRREARAFIKTCTWNVLSWNMKRRLVQANWEPYVDSFTYNAKGNGNGR